MYYFKNASKEVKVGDTVRIMNAPGNCKVVGVRTRVEYQLEHPEDELECRDDRWLEDKYVAPVDPHCLKVREMILEVLKKHENGLTGLNFLSACEIEYQALDFQEVYDIEVLKGELQDLVYDGLCYETPSETCNDFSEGWMERNFLARTIHLGSGNEETAGEEHEKAQ